MTMKSESEIRALLNLLDDSNSEIYNSVKVELLNCGSEIIEFIDEYSKTATFKDRYDEIEAELRFSKIIEFLNINDFSKIETLEEFCFLLPEIEYSDIDRNYYADKLNLISIEIKDRIATTADPFEKLKRIIDYIFKELKYSGNTENYYELDNNFISSVVDRKKGNPITLSLLFIFICNRLNVPIKGIGLPGHFITLFNFEKMEIYIDPFNFGNLLNLEECKQIVQKNGYAYSDEIMMPISNKKIIERIFRNLTYYFEKIENKNKSQLCLRCIDIIREIE